MIRVKFQRAREKYAFWLYFTDQFCNISLEFFALNQATIGLRPQAKTLQPKNSRRFFCFTLANRYKIFTMAAQCTISQH